MIYYKISGNLENDSIINIIDESTYLVEQVSTKSSGNYLIPIDNNNGKIVVARRTSNGEVVGYSNVIPVELESEYPIPFIETFTGTDLSLPNPTLWSRNGTTETLSTIYNNRLRMYYNLTGGANSTSVNFNYKIYGDFDIQVYLLTEQYGVSTGGALVRSFTISSGYQYMQFDLTRGYSGAVYHRINYDIGAGNVTFTPSPTMSDTIYFRMTRVGALWTAYTSIDGTTWTTRLSNINVGSGPVNSIQMRGYRDKATFNISWDNFTVNQGVIIS